MRKQCFRRTAGDDYAGVRAAFEQSMYWEEGVDDEFRSVDAMSFLVYYDAAEEYVDMEYNVIIYLRADGTGDVVYVDPLKREKRFFVESVPTQELIQLIKYGDIDDETAAMMVADYTHDMEQALMHAEANGGKNMRKTMHKPRLCRTAADNYTVVRNVLAKHSDKWEETAENVFTSVEPLDFNIYTEEYDAYVDVAYTVTITLHEDGTGTVEYTSPPRGRGHFIVKNVAMDNLLSLIEFGNIDYDEETLDLMMNDFEGCLEIAWEHSLY